MLMNISASDIKKKISLISNYLDCINWKDFGDKGSPCYNPLHFSNKNEELQENLTLGFVRTVLNRESSEYKRIASEVASELSLRWVTYDWLCKAITRLIAKPKYAELESLLLLSRNVKNGMKSRGLTTISSVDDALS